MRILLYLLFLSPLVLSFKISAEILVDLNQQDIANVNILKGATSVTLYGSKGANGAIIVTTKSGKNNEKISVNVNSAISFTIALVISFVVKSDLISISTRSEYSLNCCSFQTKQ